MIEQKRRAIDQRPRQVLRSQQARARRRRVLGHRALQTRQLLVDRAHVIDDRPDGNNPNARDPATTMCADDFEDYPGLPRARYTLAKMKARSTAPQPEFLQVPKNALTSAVTLMLKMRVTVRTQTIL